MVNRLGHWEIYLTPFSIKNFRYLYEINALEELESLCDVNMITVETLKVGPEKRDLEASIMSYQANLAESFGNAEKAIELNKKVYKIRLDENPLKHALLCFTSNNLGYCYNTANDHKTAQEWFERSRDWLSSSIGSQNGEHDCPPFILKNITRYLF